MARKQFLLGTLAVAIAAGAAGGRAPIAALSAPPAVERPASEIDPEVLALRESAWRSWFAGDEKALGAMLPAEFIAIGGGPGHKLEDRAATLESSRQFKASGGRLVSLNFPETRAQRYGDTMILYGTYEAAFETSGGKETMRGRLTEIFVKSGGRWMHPGWHLDLVQP